MKPQDSLLQAINQKEFELRQRLHEARRQMQEAEEQAEQQAREAVLLAEQQGKTEAEALYRAGIDQAQTKADALLLAARNEALAIRQSAATRLQAAAREVVEWVLSTPTPTSDPADSNLSADSSKAG